MEQKDSKEGDYVGEKIWNSEMLYSFSVFRMLLTKYVLIQEHTRAWTRALTYIYIYIYIYILSETLPLIHKTDLTFSDISGGTGSH